MNGKNGDAPHAADGAARRVNTSVIAPRRGGAPNPAAASAGIPASLVIAAFRRRWLMGVSLGLAVGIAAAILAWKLVPAPFTASSDLRIASVQEQDVVLHKLEEQEANFNTYKQTQMRAILNRSTLIRALGEEGIANLSIIREHQHPVDWLQEKLQVSSPDTEFIRVALSHPTDRPSELSELVNAVVNSYLALYANQEQDRQQKKRLKLEAVQTAQNEELRRLRDHQRTLAEAAAATDVSQLSLQQQSEIAYGNQLMQKLAEIRFELKSVEGQIALLETDPEAAAAQMGVSKMLVNDALHNDEQYKTVQKKIFDKRAYITELTANVRGLADRGIQISNDNVMARQLRQAEGELERLEQALADHEAERRPEIVERLKSEKVVSAEAGLGQLKLRKALLEQERSEFEKELLKTRQLQKANVTLSFDMDQVVRDIEVAEATLQEVQSQLKQLELEAKNNNRVETWDAAQVPYERDFGMRYSTTAMAGLGGFGGILALVIWMELMSRRISTVEEISNGLSIQVLGTMPHMPRWVTNSHGKKQRDRRAVFHAVLKESVDATRTMILRDAQRDAMQVLLVASALGGEGKTSLSCHLAMSLARAGRRTLLLDADLRRPSAHEVLGKPLRPGFCEVLRGEVSLEEAVQNNVAGGLSFLPAGKLNGEALQTLAQNGAEPIFKQLRLDFDIIIVDSSPILPVADTLLMAQQVDGVIFSILRDVSRYSKIAAACERLAMLGVPLLGSVAIGLETAGDGYRSQEKYYRTAGREDVVAVRNN